MSEGLSVTPLVCTPINGMHNIEVNRKLFLLHRINVPHDPKLEKVFMLLRRYRIHTSIQSQSRVSVALPSTKHSPLSCKDKKSRDVVKKRRNREYEQQLCQALKSLEREFIVLLLRNIRRVLAIPQEKTKLIGTPI